MSDDLTPQVTREEGVTSVLFPKMGAIQPVVPNITQAGARTAAEAAIEELESRCGFDEFWGNIRPEIKDEIWSAMTDRIYEHVSGRVFLGAEDPELSLRDRDLLYGPAEPQPGE